MSESDYPGLGRASDTVRVFVIYDREQDEDLMKQLVEQASRATLAFEISGRSVVRSSTDHWDEGPRRSIQEADQVIVICGPHTDQSVRVAAELRIATTGDGHMGAWRLA